MAATRECSVGWPRSTCSNGPGGGLLPCAQEHALCRCRLCQEIGPLFNFPVSPAVAPSCVSNLLQIQLREGCGVLAEVLHAVHATEPCVENFTGELLIRAV